MRCVLLAALLLATGQLVGQSQLEVEGVLKGYFLTSEGSLAVYEVPFHFPQKPYETALPSRLYPVWSRYYLKMCVKAKGGQIQRLQIQVGKERHSVTKEVPSEQVFIPEVVGEWLSVHAKVGLDIKVAAEMTDGEKVTVRPFYAVQMGDLQPLKIDWQDLVRISQIREFLRRHGDEILPGLRADDVPILLEGEEGQGVLVGNKFPHEWRYKGIVPTGLQVYLLPFRIRVTPTVRERVLAGIFKVRKIGIVAILCHQPGWDAIEEMNNPRSLRHGERTFSLLHEIVHYWIGQKYGWERKPKFLNYFDLDGYLAWILEGNALARALASQGQPQREAVRDFLFFRWLRRRLGCGDAQEEQDTEWEEGVAYAAAEKAMKLGAIHLRLNPAAYAPYLYYDLDASDLTERLILPFNPVREPFYHQFGYAQARILTELIPNWLSQVPKRRALESLLADTVGFLPEDITALTEEQARQKVREYAQKSGIIFLPSLPEPQDGLMLVWLVTIGDFPSIKVLPENLPFVVFKKGCDFVAGKVKIQSHREVMIAQVAHQKGTLLLFGWRLKPGEALQFKAEGKEVIGQGQGIAARAVDVEVWQAPHLILVGPKGLARMWAEMFSKSQEVKPMKLTKAWTAIAVAMMLTSGVTQGQGMQVTGSVAGIFLNTRTGQREFRIINLVPSLDMSDYSLLEPIDDEEYQITISVADPDAQLLRLALVLTDGQEVAVESDQPTNQLTLTYRGKWYKFLRPISELVEWIGRTVVKIVKTIGEQMLERALQELLQGKKGTLAIHVRITDAEQNTTTSFIQVTIEIWRDNKRILPPPNETWIIQTDDNGNLSIPLPRANGYLVRAKRFGLFAACPEVWAGPYNVEENQTTHARVVFYYHKPIKGRVMEQTSNGQLVALPTAQAYLYRGDQQLSGPWYSDSDGYFFIPYFDIDGVLEQHGSSTYTIKVIPPSRSMLRPEPVEGKKDVTLTRCERLKPDAPCPRAKTVDVGIFVFTYQPPENPPGVEEKQVRD